MFWSSIFIIIYTIIAAKKRQLNAFHLYNNEKKIFISK
jgi:hypothetical protein